MSRLTLEISQASGPILQVRLGRDQEALAGGGWVVEAVGGGGDVCGGWGVSSILPSSERAARPWWTAITDQRGLPTDLSFLNCCIVWEAQT